jgi:hypothetical protein
MKLFFVVVALALITVTCWAGGSYDRADLTRALGLLAISLFTLIVNAIIARRKGRRLTGWYLIVSAIPFLGLLLTLYLYSQPDKHDDSD